MTHFNAQALDRSDLPDLYRFLMRYYKEQQRLLWDQRRLDELLFHRADATTEKLSSEPAARCAFWRDEHGTIVAAVFSESPGRYTPHILHDARPYIPALLDWLSRQKPTALICHDEDKRWSAPLIAAGYRPGGVQILSLSCHLAKRHPHAARLADRYRIRQLQSTPAEAAAMAELLNTAHTRTTHTADAFAAYQRSAPSYAQTLDLVVDDGTGHLLATAGVAFVGSGDHQLAVLDPIATRPIARRLGCATALLEYGFAAAQRRGIQTVVVRVDAHNSVALQFFAHCGFMKQAHERAWVPNGA